MTEQKCCEECIVFVAKDLAHLPQFSCDKKCKCHSRPEVPEWREQMIKDAHLVADLFVPIQGEVNKSTNTNLASAIIGFCLEVREATLEEAAEAIENFNFRPISPYEDHRDFQNKMKGYLNAKEDAMTTIRSLKKKQNE